MLRGLYDLGIQGKAEEFTAYRILMLIHGRNRSGNIVLPSTQVHISHKYRQI